MVALERKFDELLSFVQLIAKRNTDDENQRKRTRIPMKENRKGIPTPTSTPPRPPTPPKPEGERLPIPSLAQYGFNSQIAPDRFDLQRMEKKSNETFREYAQRWREKAARARPPLDEREMIKIFVDTLKNPYFDRMMGLQMQFFVDLIPPNRPPRKLRQRRKEGDVQMIGRNNGRPRQVLPTFTMQPIQPRPIQAYSGPAPTQAPAPAPAPQMPARPWGNQPNDNRRILISPTCPEGLTTAHRRKGLSTQTSACDFPLWRRLPNITTNPLPKHPEGGVNMVEIEEGNEESIAWRRLFYTLEKQKHITPLDAPPGPSTGDSLGREEIPSKGSRQPDDPSDFDWYAEINLDDIVEDEMDLDNLQDEEADWGYFMEDDTDEWRDVDFTEFFQFPCLIVPPGFVTPEFEIFYEDGDPEVHLQKYGEKMALHLENELLMISVFPESLSKQAAAWFYQLRNLTGWDDLVRVFLERYRFNPHSILEYLGLKKDEEPYIIPDPGVMSARKTRQPEPSRSDPTRALRIKYSQEEGPRHISQAYLGGNVCAKILSDPLQLGPRAKTLRQEVHFSYHTQLSDRQELLRSSRNLSQKLTPWHKEHSDGLRSQDHILRTQARLCARPVPLKSRRNKAVLKFPEFSHRRCHACAQSLPDSQQVDLRARAHWKEDTSMHDVELSDRQEFIGRKLSDGTKNVKIRHRELGQICARTGTRFEKKRAGSKTHFFSRTAAFARRVFPARNKLIREPGCVGKIMTPATSWNSRFAESIPRLIGIFAGRVHENSSDTPTSGSHNSLVRTPIRANFISLERGRRELSDDMPHDPVLSSRRPPKLPPKIG
uniref:Retrotransposon gag domain-containing protein n=1 Tax=Fagus sylvatica TaxID=28930 RepID=A0A2N9I1K0_FAGSY